MSLNDSSMQHPADLRSEASFGQENVMKEMAFDPESEEQMSQSMRDIQVDLQAKRQQANENNGKAEKLKQDEEQYKRLLSIKPQTVEEIREKVKLQLQFEQKATSLNQSKQSFAPKSITTNDKKKPIVSVASPTKSKKNKKSMLWYYENREKAEFEFAFREYLSVKEQKKHIKPEIPKTFQPIIIKPDERKVYDSFKEMDYDAATPCSEDQSNFAFETGNELMANFKQVFENVNMSMASKASKKRRHRVNDFRDDELRLVAHLFSKIPEHDLNEADPKEDYVKKGDFGELLISMRETMLLYNIRAEELGKELLKFNTQKPGYLNLSEAGEFLMQDREPLSQVSQKQIKRFKKKAATEEEDPANPKTLITEEQLNVIKDIYLNIDTYGELRVSLKQLTNKIRTDGRTKDWMERPAAFVKEVSRSILLEDIFNEWDQWMAVGKEQDRRTKETVDWEMFSDMLLNYKRKEIPSRDKVFAAQRLLGRYDFGDTLEIPNDFLKAIKLSIESAPKYAENYINSFDFIADIKSHKLYPLAKSKFVREKKHYDLEIETIDDVLRRMELECENYHTQDEILDFFSRKGRPKYLSRRLKLEKQKELLKDDAHKGGSETEGEGSDEDAKKIDKKQKRKHRKVAKILGTSTEEAQKQLEKNSFMTNANFGAQFKSKDEEYQVTVPEPFQFDSRDKQKTVSIRQRRLNEMLQEKQDLEDHFVSTATAFRANKIPKHIRNTKLWSQIMAKNNKRREEVKKESKAITLSRENPFSFYYRDLQKVKERRNAVPEKFKNDHFKAKHAPWTSLVKLYDRLLQRQAKRSKDNVEKRRAELSETSKLPQGVKNMLKRLKTKDQEMENKRNNRFEEFSFAPPRAKPVPKFEDLQRDFSSRLAEKKQDFMPTVAIPFRFQETRKGVSRDYLDKENMKDKQQSEGSGKANREKRLKRILTLKVKHQPPSTKKFEALVAKNRQDQESKEFNRFVIENREQDKNLRREKFAEFVNGCIKNVNHSEQRNQLKALKNHQRDEKMREQYEWEQQFDENMTEMMRNVIRRPLLIEQEQQNIGGEVVDQDGNQIPNFGEMTEEQLLMYLDPNQDLNTLEARKQLYLQYVQRSGQMPGINELDDEDDEQMQESHPSHHEQEKYEEQAQNENPDHQYDLQDEQHDEDEFEQHQEFIDQQNQVQQLQQQQQNSIVEEDAKYEQNKKTIGKAANSSSQVNRSYQESKSQQHSQKSNSFTQNIHQSVVAVPEVNGADLPDAKDYQEQIGFNDDEEEYDDEEFEYRDEYGNPIPPEVIQKYKLEQQGFRENLKDEQEFEEDGNYDAFEGDEDVEFVDEDGNVIPPEVIQQYKKQHLLQQQLGTDSAFNQGDERNNQQVEGQEGFAQEGEEEYEEEFDDEEFEYVDEEGNPIDPAIIKQMKQQEVEEQRYEAASKGSAAGASASQIEVVSQQQKVDVQAELGDDGDDSENEEEVYYDQYNQPIPPDEVKKYKEMAARGEIDMEEYEEGEEPEFETQEEYINFYVDQKMQELREQGSQIPEAEVRKQITAQIMAEQQEQDEMDQELEEAIAGLSPVELAQFVDQSGRQLNKDEIKYILMQRQAEAEYYEGEEFEGDQDQE